MIDHELKLTLKTPDDKIDIKLKATKGAVKQAIEAVLETYFKEQ